MVYHSIALAPEFSPVFSPYVANQQEEKELSPQEQR
jgi:hypothetical protein